MEVASLPVVSQVIQYQKIAGHVQSVTLGSHVMLRVDVPEIKFKRVSYMQPGRPAQEVTIEPFTKFYSPNSVYAMTPVSEESARAAMQSFRVQPIQEFSLAPALPAPAEDEDDDEAGFDPNA